MIIEMMLILLGVLTIALGIWNLIIGAYVWGGLFLIGGMWSLWLGIVYIIQLKKLQKAEPSKDTNALLSEIIKEDNEIILDDNLNKAFSKLKMEPSTVQEDAIAAEERKFNEAIDFTNEVIPNPSVNIENLDDYEANAQIPTNINDINRNVEVIQEIVDRKSSLEQETQDQEVQVELEIPKTSKDEELEENILVPAKTANTNSLVIITNEPEYLVESKAEETSLVVISSKPQSANVDRDSKQHKES